MWMLRAASVTLVLFLAGAAGAQVPPLPGEARMEAALAEGDAALAAKDWAAALARYGQARAALPDALGPLAGLARASEGAGRPLEAAGWYRAYLAAAHEPDDDQRLAVCQRIAQLVDAHGKRIGTALELGRKVVGAATKVVETAPPPEGSTREVERARLAPARQILERAERERKTPPRPSAGDDGLRQGVGIAAAWAALMDGPDWGEMTQSYQSLGEKGRHPIERAMAAANHASLHVSLGHRIAALAEASDDVGRGCQ